MSVKIYCPKCGRVLGDTDRDLNGVRINCHSCKQAVEIKLKILKSCDYLKKSDEKEQT